MIFSKILKLSPVASKRYNKGDIVSLSQVDASKATFIFNTLPDVIILPFKILILLISLYLFIGIALLAAIGVIVIFVVANYIIAVMSKKVQRQRMKRTSNRIHKVTEIVDNIKLIKFNSWIEKYLQIANQARNRELVMKVRREILAGINGTFMNLNYPLLSISVFIVAILVTKMSIAVPTALAILQLLSSLNESSRLLPTFISDVTEFMVSIERIQSFLQCDELEIKRMIYDKSDDTSISIKNCYFYWGFEQSGSSENNCNKIMNKSKL